MSRLDDALREFESMPCGVERTVSSKNRKRDTRRMNKRVYDQMSDTGATISRNSESVSSRKYTRKRNKKNMLGKGIAIGVAATILVQLSAIGLGSIFSFAKKNKTKTEESTIGIEEVVKTYSPITRESFNALVDKAVKQHEAAGLSISREQTMKYVLFLNLDQVLQDDISIYEEIVGSQDPDEVYADADLVAGARKTYNLELFNKNENMDGFLLTSDLIYSEEQQGKVKELEKDLKGIDEVKSDEVLFNERVNAMLNEAFNSDGKYAKLESGVGYMALYEELSFPWGYGRPDIINRYSRLNEENVALYSQVYTTPYSEKYCVGNEGTIWDAYCRNIYALIDEAKCMDAETAYYATVDDNNQVSFTKKRK